MPMAQNAPAARGSRARLQPSARATLAPCIGPAPPAATRVKVAGLWPRSMLSRSTACSRFCSSSRITPDAAVLDRQAERLGELRLDRLARQRAVERDRAAGERAGPQAPEHELRVGDGRLLAAQPVGGGTGPRAGALRADMQQARIVDPGDRAAARADGVDLDRRRRQVIAVDRSARRRPAPRPWPSPSRRSSCRRSPSRSGWPPRPAPAQPLSAPTPAAGPDSTSITGRAATWSTETAPPLLCSSSSECGRPSWRSWRSSACR